MRRWVRGCEGTSVRECVRDLYIPPVPRIKLMLGQILIHIQRLCRQHSFQVFRPTLHHVFIGILELNVFQHFQHDVVRGVGGTTA